MLSCADDPYGRRRLTRTTEGAECVTRVVAEFRFQAFCTALARGLLRRAALCHPATHRQQADRVEEMFALRMNERASSWTGFVENVVGEDATCAAPARLNEDATSDNAPLAKPGAFDANCREYLIDYPEQDLISPENRLCRVLRSMTTVHTPPIPTRVQTEAFFPSTTFFTLSHAYS